MPNKTLQTTEYKEFIQSIKSKIHSSQIKAHIKVNEEMLKLYWNIGEIIVEKQKKSSWGDGFIADISKDIQKEFPDMKGFSATNIKYMRKWYVYYTNSPQAVDFFKDKEIQKITPQIFQIPWGHNREIITKCKNTPFEDTASIEEKEIFKTLKRAVKNREYVKITFKGKEEPQDNLKCLKLIFMEGNWYLAYVDVEDNLKFGRISFMDKVEYASKAESFQPSTVTKQMHFLKNIQNAMTLYGKPTKTARLKARGMAAKYFYEGMKPFLSSQKFEKILDDGSVIFTLEYTQAIEIMPFIQSWLPNIIILEPQELKEQYMKRLNFTINNHN